MLPGTVHKIPLSKINSDDRFRYEMGDIKELANAIKEKGLIQPITIDEDFKILAGGRRFRAHEYLNAKTINAIIRPVEDELDAREIELMENIHRKDMNWKENANLTARIHELMIKKHGQRGTQDSTGWSIRDTAKLTGKSFGTIQGALKMKKALDVIPELANEKDEAKARRKFERIVKDIEHQEALSDPKIANNVRWASDHFKVGDALDGMKDIEGVFHFAEVDPPYAIGLDEIQAEDKTETYTEIDPSKYVDFICKAANLVYQTLHPNAYCIWWFGPTWHNEVKSELQLAGFKVDDIPAIWHKVDSPAHSNNPNVYLTRAYEPFFICRKGKPQLYTKGKCNVFPFASVTDSRRIHATERPMDLIQELLSIFAWPKARIICPFLGSGNTLLACYKSGMSGIGWDLSKEHKNRFLMRVAEEFPGQVNREEQEM